MARRSIVSLDLEHCISRFRALYCSIWWNSLLNDSCCVRLPTPPPTHLVPPVHHLVPSVHHLVRPYGVRFFYGITWRSLSLVESSMQSSPGRVTPPIHSFTRRRLVHAFCRERLSSETYTCPLDHRSTCSRLNIPRPSSTRKPYSSIFFRKG
jgi:hypothetical protein